MPHEKLTGALKKRHKTRARKIEKIQREGLKDLKKSTKKKGK